MDDFKELLENGIGSIDLLALTHTFIGRKQQITKSKSSSGEKSSDERAVLRKKLRKAKEELHLAENTIQAMQSSKFWKLRNIWFSLKGKIDL